MHLKEKIIWRCHSKLMNIKRAATTFAFLTKTSWNYFFGVAKTNWPDLVDQIEKIFGWGKSFYNLDTTVHPRLSTNRNILGRRKRLRRSAIFCGTNMVDVVRNLCDGWCGNIIRPPPGNLCQSFIRGKCDMIKMPTSCNAHILHSIKECEKIIWWCAGIEGTIFGGVAIFHGCSADRAVPIDTIINLTRDHGPNYHEEDNEVELIVDRRGGWRRSRSKLFW